MRYGGPYEIGYGQPPKAHRYVKGQSGNLTGRKKKPLSTLAVMIEKALLESVSISYSEEKKRIVPFEVITIGLIAKIGRGVRKAHRVYRKYETFAKTRPRLEKYIYQETDPQAYAAYLKGDPDWNKQRPNLPEAQEDHDRRARAARIARMKAGFEEIKIEDGMTAREACELWALYLERERKSPPVSARQPVRRRKKMDASEMFALALNDLVTVNEGGKRYTAPRITATVRRLLVNAMRGDINSADMLMDLHAHSLKHGDFWPETKWIRE